MTILVVPNLTCNLGCSYCFAYGYDWNKTTSYNMEAILNSMDALHKDSNGENFCLHGGECTIIDRKDLETLMKKMYQLQGKSSLQTNCYRIDDDLIRMFKAFKTSVGISIDGDKGLNLLRGFPNNKKKNREYTNEAINNIFRLQREGISIGLIVVLTKVNAGLQFQAKKTFAVNPYAKRAWR